MNILDEIVSKKRIRVSEAKSIVSIEDIQNQLAKSSSLKSNFKYNLENGVANLIDNFDKYVETLDSKRIKKLKFLLENGEINKIFY